MSQHAYYFCKGDAETKKAVGKIANILFNILTDYFSIVEKTVCPNCLLRFKTPCVEAGGRAIVSCSHFVVNVLLPVIQYNLGPKMETPNQEAKLRKILVKHLKKELDKYLLMPLIYGEESVKVALSEKEYRDYLEKATKS